MLGRSLACACVPTCATPRPEHAHTWAAESGGGARPAPNLLWPPELGEHSQMKPVTPPQGAGALTKQRVEAHTVWHDSQVNFGAAFV